MNIKVLLIAFLLSIPAAGWSRSPGVPEECAAERVSGSWAGASAGGHVLAIMHLSRDGKHSIRLWNDGYLNLESLIFDTPSDLNERSEHLIGTWRLFRKPEQTQENSAEIRLDLSARTHSSRTPQWDIAATVECFHYGPEITINLTSVHQNQRSQLKIPLNLPASVLRANYHYERFLEALRLLR
jgi:hypothetical protein